MDATQDNLLTSSDYEHLIENLRSDNNSFQLHVDQDYTHVNHGKHITNDLQAHGDPSPTLENYIVPDMNGPMEHVQNTTPLEVPPPSFSPTCRMPCRDDYLGPLNFELFLNSASAHRRSWVYSHMLNKVFIDMKKSLLVQFRIQRHINGLIVRAVPVYSKDDDDDVSTPVQRCDMHKLNEDVLNNAHRGDPPMCYCSEYSWVRHVVRSNHPQAQYEYDYDSDRHSVGVPLEAPPAGSDTVVVEYHFSCKTSCPRGMNRKPIDVIFTLETEQREVIGRYVLPVKICSCPKRDKEKEELDVETKNKDPLRPGKRRMSNAAEKNDGSKMMKTDNVTPQKNGVGDETNDMNNEMGLTEVNNILVSQIVELKAEVVQQRQEMAKQGQEMAQQRQEMAKQGQEMAQQRVEIMNTLSQLQNDLVNRIEPLLNAIYQRQSQV